MSNEEMRWSADLSSSSIIAYVNRGYGLLEDGVTHSTDGIRFETSISDECKYPMFAIDFREYLNEKKVSITDIASIEAIITIYDDYIEEIPITGLFEKFALVSEDCLDGYSDSDILPGDSYKQMGSKIITRIDLTEYTGYTADGRTLTKHTLEEAAGINIQYVNGNIANIRSLVLSELIFTMNDYVAPENEKKNAVFQNISKQSAVRATAPTSPVRQLTELEALALHTPSPDEGMVDDVFTADLTNPLIIAYINKGYGITTDCATKSEEGIQFEGELASFDTFPMFAISFEKYLQYMGLEIKDVKSIDIVISLYDEAGEEIDMSDDYQKICIVSSNELNGYSNSDIFPVGNYRTFSYDSVTNIDMTTYTGFEADGVTPMKSKPENAAGINIQILNGDYKAMKFLLISSLKFNFK